MCRSENDPNGPYRCSADMHNALLAAQSHYRQAVENRQRLESEREQLSMNREHFEVLTEQQPHNSKFREHLEITEQSEIDMNKALAGAQTREQAARQQLRTAQGNYDSTRKGMQDISDEYNVIGKRLRQGDDLTDDQRAHLEERRNRLKTRFEGANARLLEERKKPLAEEAERMGATEGIDYALVDNEEERTIAVEEFEEAEEYATDIIVEEEEAHEDRRRRGRHRKEDDETESAQARVPAEDEEETPRGRHRREAGDEEAKESPVQDGSEILDHPELNAELDRMVDELDISAVDKRYKGIIDPETGKAHDVHEIQAISRRHRREARERLRRIRMEEGDRKEILRDFLRSAMYRALRYNKDTRKIMRLIGLRHFNGFMEKLDDVVAENKSKKVARMNDKWRARRNDVAESELKSIREELDKHTQKHEARITRLNDLKEMGAISDDTHEKHVAYEKSKYSKATDRLYEEQSNVELTQASWAVEEMEEQKAQERRDALAVDAMRERERRQEQIDEAITQANL